MLYIYIWKITPLYPWQALWEFREVVFQPKVLSSCNDLGLNDILEDTVVMKQDCDLSDSPVSGSPLLRAELGTFATYIIHKFYHLSMLTFSLWTFIYSVFFCLEVTLWHVSAWMLIRGQAEEKEASKGQGRDGEKHPAALQNLCQLAL